MSLNLLNDRPFVFLGSRLKRLSDWFLTDAAKIHELCGFKISPSQSVLLAQIGEAGEISVTALSQILRQSQPAITKNLKTLESLRLINTEVLSKDNRVKLVTLSDEGVHVSSKIRARIWPGVETSVREILGKDAELFIKMLGNIEGELTRKSFETRFKEGIIMDENQINIIEYSHQFANDWYEINREWIEENFKLEPIDEFILKNPQNAILEKGGVILLAKHSTLGIVGTCALMPIDDEWWELTKLGVRSNLRGLKIGKKIFEATVQKGMDMGIKKLFLLTNAKQKAGISLYENSGWIHSKEIMEKFGHEYERCNVAMIYNP